MHPERTMTIQRKPMGKTYVVFRGRQPGFYSTWPECQAQVTGFSGAVYRAFSSQDDAHSEWISYWHGRHEIHNEENMANSVFANEAPPIISHEAHAHPCHIDHSPPTSMTISMTLMLLGFVIGALAMHVIL